VGPIRKPHAISVNLGLRDLDIIIEALASCESAAVSAAYRKILGAKLDLIHARDKHDALKEAGLDAP